jgi:osmoprotectant transport system ATP-binding protein
MDEPFGALDPIIRSRAQADLRQIQRRLGTTIVLVTHDMNEAIHLGDRIAVMDRSRLLQYDDPREIVVHPATPFVGELLGSGERPFRLLSLQPISAFIEPGEASGEPLSDAATLRDALEEALWTGRSAVPVRSQQTGAIVGRVTLDTAIRQAARPQ